MCSMCLFFFFDDDKCFIQCSLSWSDLKVSKLRDLDTQDVSTRQELRMYVTKMANTWQFGCKDQTVSFPSTCIIMLMFPLTIPILCYICHLKHLSLDPADLSVFSVLLSVCRILSQWFAAFSCLSSLLVVHSNTLQLLVTWVSSQIYQGATFALKCG